MTLSINPVRDRRYWFLPKYILSEKRSLVGRCLAVLTILILFTNAGLAQESDPVVVGFVVNREIQTALPTDTGPEGLSRLAEIFEKLNARLETIDLRTPVPPEIDIVVLVRPLRELTYNHVMHLWDHIQNGKHVLLTIDPLTGERANQGLDRVLMNSYGLGIEDYFLIKNGTKDVEPLRDLNGNRLDAHADDFTPHEITEPLLADDSPVQVWAARPIRVNALWPGAVSAALLYTEDAYGEAGNIFATVAGDPLEFDIDRDIQGHLLIGGLSTNTRTGSRIVLLGDSEMVTNGFGLSRDAETDSPDFPGDLLFAERAAAWLVNGSAS